MRSPRWVLPWIAALPFPAAGAQSVENEALRLEISPETGAIVRLLDKRSGIEFVTDAGQARLFELQIPDATNYSRRIASWTQRPTTVRRAGASMVVHYAQLQPDTEQYRFGSGVMTFAEPMLAIDARVTLTLRDDHIEASLQLDNRSRVPITGVVFPYVGGLASRAGETPAAIVLPSTGRRVFRDTAGALSGQRAIRYPGLLATSWINYELGSQSLGVEVRSDAETQDAWFSLSSGPFQSGSAYRGRYAYPFVAWIHYPHIEGTGRWTSPPATLHVHAADWHAIAAEHREWARSERKPTSDTHWKEQLGFASFRLKRDDGTIEHNYRDLTRLAASAERAGLRTLVVEGWRRREGPHNPSPFGEVADPRLGGVESLATAVDDLGRRDVKTLFAFHPAVLNVLRDEPPPPMALWPVKSRRLGNQLPVDFIYHTSDAPQSFQGPTYRVEIDPSSTATDYLLREAQRLRDDYGFRHLLLKGIGQRSFLSYNRHHGVPPERVYVEGYRRLLGGLRHTFADGLLMNEGVNDLVDPYADGAYTWNQSQDAAVLAYSAPWTAYSHDVEALDYAAANLAFAHRLLVNVVVDGGLGTVEGHPNFAAHVRGLQQVKASASRYYGEAEFRDQDGLRNVRNDEGVLTKVLVNTSPPATGIVVANLRDAAATARFELARSPDTGNARLLPGTGSLDLTQPVELQLAPYEVRLITFDGRLAP